MSDTWEKSAAQKNNRRIPSFPQVVPDDHEEEPGIEHDRPGPGESRVDRGKSLEVLYQYEDEPGQKTDQAQLFF